MAVTAASIIEVALLGSDGNAGVDTNGGMFDPVTNIANMITDLAATVATGSAPVVTSAAQYTFVAGDVNSWLFVSSGTSWTPGWYKIASVNAGAATLSAAAGAGVLYATGGPYSVTTAAGCATVASPTAGTGSVDYSQVGTAVVSNTNLASANGTNATPTVTSASRTFNKNDVGNYISITAGVNWTTGVFRITNTSAGGAILDRACGSAASISSGTFAEGGCLLSPGQAGTNHVAGSHIFIKNGTYTILSATLNGATNCLSLTGTTSVVNQTAVFGYGTVRTDAPKTTSRPTLILNTGVSTAAIITMASGADTTISYLIVDGHAETSSRGITFGNNADRAYYVTGKNCTNAAFSGGQAIACDATGCSAVSAFNGTNAYWCTAWSNTITGFLGTGATCSYCLSVNNTGTADGFGSITGAGTFLNCTAYANGRDGFRFTSTAGSAQEAFNCISYLNVGTQFNSTAASDLILLVNCAGGITLPFATNITNDSMIGSVTLTADPFVNAAGGNFGLNPAGTQYSSLHNGSIVGAYPGLPNTVNNADIGGAGSSGTGGNSIFGDG